MANNNRTVPASRNPDIVTFTIQVDGTALPGIYQILGITVSRELNRLPMAEIVIKDGDPASESFQASSGEEFVPGKALKVLLGYHSDEEVVFEGKIVRQSIRIREGSSRLYVDCRDAAFVTSLARRSRYFEDSTDSDAIETILGAYAGLSAEVDATSVTHRELMQYRGTDWDFILSRADANGLLVDVNAGRVRCFKPDFSADPILTIQYGATILELDAELDGRTQVPGVKAIGWSSANQESEEVEAADPGYAGPGNLDGAQLAGDLAVPEEELRHTGWLPADELQAWADARLLRSRLARVRGRVRFQGTAVVNPGDLIDLGGVGDRFSGTAFVSGVTHRVYSGRWTTEVRLGWDDNWFSERYTDINEQPAGGLTPAVRGLQIGKITTLEGDPDGEDRIKVALPAQDPQSEGVWARLATLDAGNNRGFYFRPEIDDEVIVGFLNDDPRDAVILGALHSSANPAPETAADDNNLKGYFSRSELRLEFNDADKLIRLETPGGAALILDDNNGKVELIDQNGNKIVMDSSGIQIESAQEMGLTATTDLNSSGVNVTLEAQAGLTVKGGATAELSAGGSTTVKGGVVQIN